MNNQTIEPYKMVTLQDSKYFEMNRDEFEMTPEGWLENELQFFEGDPDILYFNGEPVAYLASVHADYGKEFIYYDMTDDNTEGLELVRQWADDVKQFTELESNWDNVKRGGYTLAYRGGQGYSYGIWALSGDINNGIQE
jgi:hypothetical protein